MGTAASYFDSCVQQMELEPSEAIQNNGNNAGYRPVDSATRYFAAEPLYSAVWIVDSAVDKERHYSPPHTHDYPELNIIAGKPGELVYDIQIGDEVRKVSSPASIVIPAGVMHSANIVSGSGMFIVYRLDPAQLDRFNTFKPDEVESRD